MYCVLAMCLYFCNYTLFDCLPFELPLFGKSFNKFIFGKQVFLSFPAREVLPGTGNSLGRESVTGCMSAYMSTRS